MKPSTSALRLNDPPRLVDGTLLLALTGWMDGGDVSSGSVRQLMRGRADLREVATLVPDDFYVFNFPGNMEIASLFRPAVKHEDGVVTKFEFPTNTFWADESANLAFFIGKEPHLQWRAFGDCIFAAAKKLAIKRIVFIGSFGGAVPHTREPRLYGSVSAPALRDELRQYGVRLSDYEGPGSFSSLLLSHAQDHGMSMLSLVTEIPGYLEGTNPLSIEAIVRRLAHMLNLTIDLDGMRETSNEWESKVTAAVAENEEMAAMIRKLEEEYDNELIRAEPA